MKELSHCPVCNNPLGEGVSRCWAPNCEFELPPDARAVEAKDKLVEGDKGEVSAEIYEGALVGFEGSFDVRVPNRSYVAGEAIARVGNQEGNALLRKGKLSIDSRGKTKLSVVSDFGQEETIGMYEAATISRVEFERSAISPFDQLMTPLKNGLVAGLVVSGIVWFKTEGTRQVSSADFIFMLVLLTLGISVFLTVLNLGKIVWSEMSGALLWLKNNEFLVLFLSFDDAVDLRNAMRSHNVQIGRDDLGVPN